MKNLVQLQWRKQGSSHLLAQKAPSHCRTKCQIWQLG
jgi:hypothetical protein